MKKLLIICGPTAIGKTTLAAKLTKKIPSELISADSRQVYQGMDIVTGKDKPQGVIIHGLDLVKPDEDFSVAHFVNFCLPLIKKIHQKNKLPILVGGTGLYLKAIIEPIDTINLPPNPKLRLKLNKLKAIELQKKLQKINPTYFNKMNHSDQNNPRRLIRAIEISLKKPAPPTFQTNFDVLWIGLTTNQQKLFKLIKKRVEKRLKLGALKEKQALIKKGYSKKLPSMSSIGYKHLPDINAWIRAETSYAKRQLTYFKAQSNIHWFDISNQNYLQTVVSQATDWYTN